LLELALSAEVAIWRLYFFFIIRTLKILLIILSNVSDVFKIFSFWMRSIHCFLAKR
jgi:hypothetical protein